MGLMLSWCANSSAGGGEDPNHSLKTAPAAFDRLIRIASIIEEDLRGYGAPAVLLGRSSSGAEDWGHEFGHSAVAMRNASGQWVVRHLYIADKSNVQYVSEISEVGFGNYLFESGYYEKGYVFALILPSPWERRLDTVARDNARILSLFTPSYSPIPDPFSTKYQNCNQWALELTAAALADDATAIQTRAQAQEWLKQEGYRPAVATANIFLRALVRIRAAAQKAKIPEDDHATVGTYHFTMPSSLAEFVQRKLPTTQRLDYCYAGNTVVLRKPGFAFVPGCTPRPEDRVIQLED